MCVRLHGKDRCLSQSEGRSIQQQMQHGCSAIAFGQAPLLKSHTVVSRECNNGNTAGARGWSLATLIAKELARTFLRLAVARYGVAEHFDALTVDLLLFDGYQGPLSQVDAQSDSLATARQPRMAFKARSRRAVGSHRHVTSCAVFVLFFSPVYVNPYVRERGRWICR